MVCFGELGWRAGDEFFVVGLSWVWVVRWGVSVSDMLFCGGFELGLGGAGVMLFVVENAGKGLYFEYGSGKIGVTKLQDI